MIDLSRLQMGDKVFWLDSMNDVIAHTFLGAMGNIAVLSGELMENPQKYQNFPAGHSPVLDSSIRNKIAEILDQNETYNPYPVCFVRPENLYEDRQDAENAAWEMQQEKMDIKQD